MEGKAGLVTAGGSGIGKASAIALAREGAKVMVADFDEKAGQETVKLIIDAGGQAAFFKCDVTDELQVKAMIDETVKIFGSLDFAHNNAGGGPGQGPIESVEAEHWERTIKLTLVSMFYSMKHEVAYMKANGGGVIVNTASSSGLEGSPHLSAYVAAKHGVVGMTKTVALEAARDNIRVNAIAPGSTLTPALQGWAESAPEQYQAVVDAIPNGKIATPEDQAKGVLFLCSDLASHVNGIILPIDGGYMAGKI